MYAPGELGKVRGRLGSLDNDEAQRMAKILGGKVGFERSVDPPESSRARSGKKVGGTGSREGTGRPRTERQGAGKHHIDLSADMSTGGGVDAGATEEDLEKQERYRKITDPADNPLVPIRLSYRERVRMDKYMGQPEFDIKSPFQVLKSIISFGNAPPDLVSTRFVTKRLNDYYKRIELLVTATRNLFPRNNIRRNERMKKVSPFVYTVLDTIRRWDIERITSELARIQARPRSIAVVELDDILKAVYRPLFILEQLDLDTHIKEAYKLVYKIIYLENPGEENEKYQDMIRTTLNALKRTREDIRYLLYPLLMKLLSDCWLPCDEFFAGRKNRLMAFLDAGPEEQILPGMAAMPAADDPLEEETTDKEDASLSADAGTDETAEPGEKKVRDNERKAVDRGLATLETLFPRSGWDKAVAGGSFAGGSSGIDLYPYFSDVFKLKKEYALITPSDPLQQIAVLLRILADLFVGLRFVKFGMIDEDNNIEEMLTPILNNWNYYIENSFEKEYLPRLSEYCRLLENPSESRTSAFAKRLINEAHWTKRLYFLPYYKFESNFPPPFQKGDITALYPEIRTLRRALMLAAGGIEQGNRQGGAERKAFCEGIENPWEPYVFQVPNPVSKRLDAILGDKQKNNASLIFFTLAAAIVLDYLVNNENSWAYSGRPGPLFRSIDDAGIIPVRGVDIEIDTEAILKEMKKKQ